MCSDSSCGLIIKSEIYYGATKSAGELNLNPPRTGVEAQKDKCWESYDYGCCLRSRGIDLGVQERVKACMSENPQDGAILLSSAADNIDNITFNHIVEAAEKGDAISVRILEEAGDYLGVKIAFIINLFNPEVVVIGRGIEKAGDILFSSIRRSVRRWAYEESVKVAKILPTSLGEDVVAVGAGALVVQDFFAKV